LKANRDFLLFEYGFAFSMATEKMMKMKKGTFDVNDFLFRDTITRVQNCLEAGGFNVLTRKEFTEYFEEILTYVRVHSKKSKERGYD